MLKLLVMAALIGTAGPRRALGTVSQTVLVAGATGYVGGRLIPELNTTGDVRVRCLARTPAKLDAAPCAPTSRWYAAASMAT